MTDTFKTIDGIMRYVDEQKRRDRTRGSTKYNGTTTDSQDNFTIHTFCGQFPNKSDDDDDGKR